MSEVAKESNFDGKRTEDETTVRGIELVTTASSPDQNDDNVQYYVIGSIVDVMPRLWPGINKPGGVGRVLRVHYDEGTKFFRFIVPSET